MKKITVNSSDGWNTLVVSPTQGVKTQDGRELVVLALYENNRFWDRFESHQKGGYVGADTCLDSRFEFGQIIALNSGYGNMFGRLQGFYESPAELDFDLLYETYGVSIRIFRDSSFVLAPDEYIFKLVVKSARVTIESKFPINHSSICCDFD